MIATTLAFIASPLGRIAGVGLLIVSLFGFGFYKGASMANARCREAALQSRIDAMQTDVAAAEQAAQAAETARKELEEAAASDKERISEYERQLAARPLGACALNDDDLRMLDGKPNRK